MNQRAVAAILVMQRSGGYKDIPGVQYHFPKQKYLSRLRELKDALVLFYEPRRGGTSANTGGRMGFTGLAYIDDIIDDPTDESHAYVLFRYFVDFTRVVPLSRTTVSAKSLQNAVRPIDYSEAERVVHEGLESPSLLHGARQGLTDIDALIGLHDRETRQIVSDRAVRDASFRYRVVEQAYGGRCAMTGIRMTNGNGRAEADAAHIRPVASDGPDSVRNGLALMKSVHWAFDRGLVSLSDEGRILLAERGIEPPVLRLFPNDRRALLPSDIKLQPHPAFLAWHREHVFKGASE